LLRIVAIIDIFRYRLCVEHIGARLNARISVEKKLHFIRRLIRNSRTEEMKRLREQKQIDNLKPEYLNDMMI